MNNGIGCAIFKKEWVDNMSYPDRERIETEEEAAPELRIVAKQNGAANGVAKNASVVGSRLQRTELAALGWDARRRRLNLK
jgi:hypothetical protein